MAAVFGLAGCGSDGTGSPPAAGGSMPFNTSVTPTPTPSLTPTPAPTPTSSPSSPAASPKPSPTTTPAKPTHVGLQLGDEGPQVLTLQKKLQAMGFWLSSADGSYGQTTEQAVLAFQKAAGLGRDGVAGPLTLKALDQGVSVQAKTTSGHWLEIDKARQLLVIATDGKVQYIFNTSTGSNQPYTQGGATYIATTPSGVFSIFRQVDGDDPGPLGDLWRPKYFNGGIAVHGAPYIPGYPASHGCARVSNAAIDWMWSTNQAPIGTKVLVY
jgi:peptidoglycan hydrolase-like protein with peptidoglycan-binding domain